MGNRVWDLQDFEVEAIVLYAALPEDARRDPDRHLDALREIANKTGVWARDISQLAVPVVRRSDADALAEALGDAIDVMAGMDSQIHQEWGSGEYIEDDRITDATNALERYRATRGGS